MQAIEVKYLPPTETRGTRIKATCRAGSITVGRDYALEYEEDSRRVAMMLQENLGWSHPLNYGVLPNGNHVYTLGCS